MNRPRSSSPPPPPPTTTCPPMDTTITEHTISLTTCPAPMFYLASGPKEGPLIIFVHGWPELSISWRHQLSALGNLGFRCIAPDMRGYGKSYIPKQKEEVEIRKNVRDLLCLLDMLSSSQSSSESESSSESRSGTTYPSKAVFVGHDWGAPITWGVAQHYPERVAGVVGLVIPAAPAKKLYALTSVDKYRQMIDCQQWDYFLHHYDHTEASHEELDADIETVIKAMFQGCYEQPPLRMWSKHLSMYDQMARYEKRVGEKKNVAACEIGRT